MLAAETPELLHIVGYLTGATLYAMLLAMVMRARDRADSLALVTAVLGLAWNVGEISVHATDALAFATASRWLAALSYSALGLLAAVVVHSVATRVRGTQDSQTRSLTSRAIAIVAYSCAAVATGMHVVAAATADVLPSSTGLAVVAIGLGALTVPLLLLTHRQPQGGRALWMTALAVFTVSALHLRGFHGANESWTTELLGHHASIPLAFAILYQDYRFALADLFLKQALTLIAAVAGVFAVYTAVEPSLRAGGPGAIVLLLAVWVATAMLFPLLHRTVTWFVDHVVLSRVNYGDVLERLSAAVQSADTADDVLTIACAELGPALSAIDVRWEARSATAAPALSHSEIAVLTADTPQYVLIVGKLAGGRRLLSGDVSMLERAAVLVARRLDALRLTEERFERTLLEREMRTLATEAELRALRAQVNPHFLFNALTTIGYLIQHAPPRALDTLMRLTTLLRSVLRSDGEFTTLGRERELIECYLQIEQERFEERLRAEIDIPKALENATIPTLIVQPLVENAIKHGIAQSRSGGTVSIRAYADRSGPSVILRISVRNSGAVLSRQAPEDEGGGVGLNNVKRRLECYYGNEGGLTLTQESGGITVAELSLPAIGIDADVAPIPVGKSLR
jgi:two-component system LytT family sensor kinase